VQNDINIISYIYYINNNDYILGSCYYERWAEKRKCWQLQ